MVIHSLKKEECSCIIAHEMNNPNLKFSTGLVVLVPGKTFNQIISGYVPTSQKKRKKK